VAFENGVIYWSVYPQLLSQSTQLPVAVLDSASNFQKMKLSVD
jgi:hypothetical protein